MFIIIYKYIHVFTSFDCVTPPLVKGMCEACIIIKKSTKCICVSVFFCDISKKRLTKMK